MNKRATFSPVLLELIVVILFFALSMSVVIRLIAAAGNTSRESELMSRALIYMESAVETVKADPADGDYDEAGQWRYSLTPDGDMELHVSVQRSERSAGALYEIEVKAQGTDGAALGSISTARYLSGEATS